jgi:REP element-mobilizing transposase RayT
MVDVSWKPGLAPRPQLLYSAAVALPLAYFITYTTYGTRLHGDDRGSVDQSHNRYGSPYLPASKPRRTFERSAMAEPPFVLGGRTRAIVHDAIVAHASFLAWTLHVDNVRTNHLHVIVTAPLEPELVMGQFKSWSSRCLHNAGLQRRHFWTPHGSTIYLWTEQQLLSKVDYVRRLQDLPERFEPRPGG